MNADIITRGMVLSTIVLCTLYGVMGSQEFSITKNLQEQVNPAIYEDIVVWQDRRNGHWDIYGYNLSACEEFRITSNPSNQVNPAIYEDIVVWQDDRNGDWDIYGYNLSAHTEFVVPTVSYRNVRPAIYGDIVVWKGYTVDRHPCIRYYNLSTREESLIDAPSTSQEAPAIYGNIVVWKGSERHKQFIYGYNIATKELFEVAETLNPFFPCCQASPAIYKDTVIWVDDNIIYQCNLLTGTKFKIAAPRPRHCTTPYKPQIYFHYPKIHNNIVVWVDCRNGNPDIYGYNLVTDEEFHITSNTAYQSHPAICNTIVVWSDFRNRNGDIYGCDITMSPVLPVSSRLWLFLLDTFHVMITVASTTGGAFIVGRHLLRVEIFQRPALTLKDFKRKHIFISWSLFFFVFIPLFYVLFCSKIEFLPSIIVTLLVIFFIADFVWQVKTPLVRITHDKIIIYPGIMHSPRVIESHAILDIDYEAKNEILEFLTAKSIEMNYIRIFLKNDDKVDINLSQINEGEKPRLVKALRQFKR